MKRDGRCAEKHTPSSAPDLGDGRDDPARQQAAAHRLVLGRLPDGDPLQRHLCPAAPKQLGIGSYRSAWLLAHKLRASMVDPELVGLVEIDEASLPFRTKDEEGGRSHDKMLIVGAIERTETAACGWPKSPPTAPPTSDTSSKPPPIPTPSRKPTAGPATLRSPPIATMSMSREDRRSPRPAVDPPSLQPRMGARRLTGCVASICRPISMSSSFGRKTRHAAFRSLFRLATNAEPLTYSMLIEPEPCA